MKSRSLGSTPSGAAKKESNMEDKKFLIVKMQDALDRVLDTVRLLEFYQLTNEQKVLDWLDELNKISVKY